MSKSKSKSKSDAVRVTEVTEAVRQRVRDDYPTLSERTYIYVIEHAAAAARHGKHQVKVELDAFIGQQLGRSQTRERELEVSTISDVVISDVQQRLHDEGFVAARERGTDPTVMRQSDSLEVFWD